MIKAILTNKQLESLRHLSIFKYLTISQFINLGVQKHRSHTQTMLSELVKFNFVDAITFGSIPKQGRLEYVYCLKKKGAAILENSFGINKENILYPKSNSYFKAEYFHRIATLNAHISFYLWANKNDKEIIFFNRDFDMLGNTRKTKGKPLQSMNRIYLDDSAYIIPDFACMFRSNSKKVLFLGEITCGHDTKLIIEKLKNHLYVLQNGLAKSKYEHDKGHYITWVFERKGAMNSVMKRMREESIFSGTERFFRNCSGG